MENPTIKKIKKPSRDFRIAKYNIWNGNIADGLSRNLEARWGKFY